jgi:hypothetical protein
MRLLIIGCAHSLVSVWRKYITANSCAPPGYSNYFGGANSPQRVLPDSYWSKNLETCQYPCPSDGCCVGPNPEQFFNCAEVSISPSTPSTEAPLVTPAPTVDQLTTNTPSKAPSNSQPPSPTGTGDDSRLIASLGNWQACPSTVVNPVTTTLLEGNVWPLNHSELAMH